MFKFKDLNLYRLYLHTYMYIYTQINYIHACDCVFYEYMARHASEQFVQNIMKHINF